MGGGLWVQNLHGTSGSRYKIGRLSHRFAAHTSASVHTCQAAGCCEPAGATAHVIAANGGGGGAGARTWLLCRVCKGHNSPRRTAPYRLRDGAVTVPVTELRAALRSKAAARKTRAKKATGAAKAGAATAKSARGGGPRGRTPAKPKPRHSETPGAPMWAFFVGLVAAFAG